MKRSRSLIRKKPLPRSTKPLKRSQKPIAKLGAHHTKYRKTLEETKLEDLEVLCTYCHRAHHSKDMKRRIA